MKSKLAMVGALALIVGATGLLESRGGGGRGGGGRGTAGGHAVSAGGGRAGGSGRVARGGTRSGTLAGRTTIRGRSGGKTVAAGSRFNRDGSRRGYGRHVRGDYRRHDGYGHGYGRGHWGFRSGGNWGPYLLGAGLASYPLIDYAVSSPYQDCYYDTDGELVCQVDDGWYYAS